MPECAKPISALSSFEVAYFMSSGNRRLDLIEVHKLFVQVALRLTATIFDTEELSIPTN